ncbi:Wif1 [Acrasis kona]|uniref:Wif1 n=1 Tax=Acrasis kona TaxID=1008807 RepID=A0AAW2Z540_9EUKA
MSGISGKTITGVDVGRHHNLFLTSDGLVYTMGSNQFGQLGYSGGNTTVPIQVNTGSATGSITNVYAGYYSSFFTTINNQSYAFGQNVLGNLGINTYNNQYSPALIPYNFGGKVTINSVLNTTIFVRQSTQFAYSCYGISYQNKFVCGGRGRCVAQDTCVCDSELVTGKDCAPLANNLVTTLVSGLSSPWKVAVDSVNNLVYFSDTDNHRVYRLNRTNMVISLFAGTGSAGSTGDGSAATSATLYSPWGLLIDSVRNLVYIASRDAHCIRVVNTNTNVITTFVGLCGTSGTTGATNFTDARFNKPLGLTHDPVNNIIFVADSLNGCVKSHNPSSQTVSVFAGACGTSQYSGNFASATNARFQLPTGIFYDYINNFFYIADPQSGYVRFIDPYNNVIPLTPNTQFPQPQDVTYDSANGILYITLSGSNNIVAYSRSTLSFTYLVGSSSGNSGNSGFNYGSAISSYWKYPAGIAFDASTNSLYVCDLQNNAIRVIVNVNYNPTPPYPNYYVATQKTPAGLSGPKKVVVDSVNALVYYTGSNSVYVYNRLTGVTSVFAGTGTSGSSGDGGAATNATLANPMGLAVDNINNLVYIATYDAYCVRAVDRNTGLISTFIGSCGTSGNTNGILSSAQVGNIHGIAIDSINNLVYLSDLSNSCIRMVNRSSNTVSTFAGQCGTSAYSGDGGAATSARLQKPSGIAYDSSINTLYICDPSSGFVRVVNTNTNVISGFSSNIQLAQPVDITIDTSRNYVCFVCGGAHALYCYSRTSNTYTMVAGSPNYVYGYNDSSSLLQVVRFANPQGVSFDPTFNITYIADTNNNAIRYLSQYNLCYNMPSTNGNVCTGNGNCTNTDTCVCNSNVYGQKCERFKCYGVWTNSTFTGCFNNATCVSPDKCLCRPGYYGAQCEAYNCYGTLYNSTTTCSGYGSCIAPDTCSCNVNYLGANCNVWLCGGVLSNSSNICSNNGLCSSPAILKTYPALGPGRSGATSFSYYNMGGAVDIFSFWGGNWQDSAQWGYSSLSLTTQRYFVQGGGVRYLQLSPNDFVKNVTIFASNSVIHCFSFVTRNNVTYYSANLDFCRLRSDGAVNSLNFTLADQEYIVGFYGTWSSSAPIGLTSLGVYTQLPGSGCQCNPNYYGVDCSTTLCYGRSSRLSTVCSGNGTCVGYNNCSCSAGYYGQQCEAFNCYGVISNSSSVCGGGGTCVSPNTCICRQGYSGVNCDVYYCNGALYNSTSVCSGNGICATPSILKTYPALGPDKAGSTPFSYYNMAGTVDIFNFWGYSWQDSAQWGYSTLNYTTPKYYTNGGSQWFLQLQPGDYVKNVTIYYYNNINCMTFTTKNGVFYKSAETGFCEINTAHQNGARNVTSYQLVDNENIVGFYGTWISNGSYIGVLTLGMYTQLPGSGCQCNANYYGVNCGLTTCYGRGYTSAGVCSGNGTCAAYNSCSCYPGYYGQQCDAYNCYGIISNNTNVCSNNGTCTGPDRCTCRAGYYGQRCEAYGCYGVISNSSSVCGGGGTCVSPNTCVCRQGYSGVNCDIYYCNGALYNSTGMCSGNGICASPSILKTYPAVGLGRAGATPFSYYNVSATVDYFSFWGDYWQDSLQWAYSTINLTTSRYYMSGGQKFILQLEPGDYVKNITIYHGNNINCFTFTSKNGIFYRSATERFCAVNTSLYNGAFNSSSYALENNENIVGFYGAWAPNGTIGIVSVGLYTQLAGSGCQCNPNYFGVDCGLTTCYGSGSKSVGVCSGNGICVSYNNCSCFTGYYGLRCESFNCYGVASNSSNVCSGGGSCVSADTCTCRTGYNGPQCTPNICANVYANDSNVCSRNGICSSSSVLKTYPALGPDKAGSTPFSYYNMAGTVDIFNFWGYSWQDSAQWGYSTLNYTTPKYYTNGGSQWFLQLQPGDYVKNVTIYYYNNINCMTFTTKNGVFYKSAETGFCVINTAHPNGARNVTSYQLVDNENIVGFYGTWISNGSYIGVLTLGMYTQLPGSGCQCNANYYGVDCSLTLCYGKSSQLSTTCNNGTCVGFNNCSCLPGYYGQQCDAYNCYGIISNNTNVCSNNGTCTGPDRCTCRAGYYGQRCEAYGCYGQLSLWRRRNMCVPKYMCL